MTCIPKISCITFRIFQTKTKIDKIKPYIKLRLNATIEHGTESPFHIEAICIRLSHPSNYVALQLLPSTSSQLHLYCIIFILIPLIDQDKMMNQKSNLNFHSEWRRGLCKQISEKKWPNSSSWACFRISHRYCSHIDTVVSSLQLHVAFQSLPSTSSQLHFYYITFIFIPLIDLDKMMNQKSALNYYSEWRRGLCKHISEKKWQN